MSEPETPATVLLVEDEPEIREGLRLNLSVEGFTILEASTGEEGLAEIEAHKPDLVLLDLMLPGISGLEVLARLRGDDNPTPVIIVSARGLDKDVVVGLEQGADDYVTKPFGLTELVARIRAVLRRTGARSGPSVAERMEFDGLTVDFKRFTAIRDGGEHALSRFEADILKTLIQRQGEVVSRDDLLRTVWGYSTLPTTRTVDNHIARLRKKVEPQPNEPRYIHTVHGHGYRFEGQPTEA